MQSDAEVVIRAASEVQQSDPWSETAWVKWKVFSEMLRHLSNKMLIVLTMNLLPKNKLNHKWAVHSNSAKIMVGAPNLQEHNHQLSMIYSNEKK